MLQLLLISLILMMVGQLVHWVLQLKRELADPNNPNMTIKDFIFDNQKLMIVNLALVVLAAIINAFTGFITIGIVNPASGYLMLTAAGYGIDSVLENLFASSLKENGK